MDNDGDQLANKDISKVPTKEGQDGAEQGGAEAAMQIDLKSMPTFRDRPMLNDPHNQTTKLDLPLHVPYAHVPYADRGDEYFTWDPETIGSTEEVSEDMLVWLACQSAEAVQQLLPVRPSLTRDAITKGKFLPG